MKFFCVKNSIFSSKRRVAVHRAPEVLAAIAGGHTAAAAKRKVEKEPLVADAGEEQAHHRDYLVEDQKGEIDVFDVSSERGNLLEGRLKSQKSPYPNSQLFHLLRELCFRLWDLHICPEFPLSKQGNGEHDDGALEFTSLLPLFLEVSDFLNFDTLWAGANNALEISVCTKSYGPCNWALLVT